MLNTWWFSYVSISAYARRLDKYYWYTPAYIVVIGGKKDIFSAYFYLSVSTMAFLDRLSAICLLLERSGCFEILILLRFIMSDQAGGASEAWE